jgi:hypothetical protein
MARHQRMPPEEAGYTFAVEPAATNRLLANEEESIYGRSLFKQVELRLKLKRRLSYQLHDRSNLYLHYIHFPAILNKWITLKLI